MSWRDAWPALFIAVRALALASCVGRFRSGEFAFTYTRGFTRDALWAHMMAASALSALAVWLPAALIVWTPLRAWVQHYVLHSPWFPIMAPREATVPLVWLVGYAVMLPAAHYSWIRLAQPTCGESGGLVMLACMFAAAFTVFVVYFRAPWFPAVVIAACLASALVLTAAARRLHRRLEVQL
jgi:hypothetical protein